MYDKFVKWFEEEALPVLIEWAKQVPTSTSSVVTLTWDRVEAGVGKLSDWDKSNIVTILVSRYNLKTLKAAVTLLSKVDLGLEISTKELINYSNPEGSAVTKKMNIVVVVGFDTLAVRVPEVLAELTSDKYDITYSPVNETMYVAETLQKLKLDYSDVEFNTLVALPYHGQMDNELGNSILQRNGFGGAVADYESWSLENNQSDDAGLKTLMVYSVVVVIDKQSYMFFQPKGWKHRLRF